ncbi:hypothetical protein SDC9_211585 [bioreactor metagenome]|uniref:Uncharacterized protein n=1 Tax=bioreactor metagenome TaxID=1076179 RepID=A0A645JM59_9ZZZZ
MPGNIVVFNPKFLAYPSVNSITNSFLGFGTAGRDSVVLDQAAVTALNIDSKIIILENIIFNSGKMTVVKADRANVFHFVFARIDDFESF